MRKKVLFFHHIGAMSGASLSMTGLIDGIRQVGYETLVCCLQNGPLVEYLRNRDVRVVVEQRLTTLGHVNGAWYPFTSLLYVMRFALALIRLPRAVLLAGNLIRAEKPDLVHINSTVLVPCAIAAWRCGIPLVWHIREAAHTGHFGIRLALLRWTVRRLPDRVICICEDNRERLRVPREKARVIYNFVDFRRFDCFLNGEVVRGELGIPHGKKVILFCGGTSFIKGGMVVPDAIRQLHRSVPDVICIVSGYLIPPGFPQRPSRPALLYRKQHRLFACAAEYATLEREGIVITTGFRMDIERLLAASDCLIFPSTAPHFARPVMEAQAMARPVVASALGGVNEIVEHGVHGLLVAPGNSEALANAVMTLFADPELMRQMGENGLSKARECFDMEVNLRQTLKVYEEVLCTFDR